MRWAAALLAAITLLSGCASLNSDGTTVGARASGDSSATDVICKGRVEKTDPDGTVTVSCEESRERTVVGGNGSAEFYKTIGTFVSVMASIASIAIQAMR